MLPYRHALLEDRQMAEVDRRSPAYIRWVQQSLNQISGAGLAVDGAIGPHTRAAVRAFQTRRGLTADGVVGPRTEAALLDAGAGPPPGSPRPTPRPTPRPAPAPPVAGANLASLQSFSRRYVREMIAAGRRIDCADLAIEIWIMFGEQAGVATSFEIWDSARRGWTVVDRSGVRLRSSSAGVRRFGAVGEYVRYVQGNLGARGLVGNTVPVAGGHRAAVAGDVFLWKYRNNQTGTINSIGHTQLVDRLQRGVGGPETDQIVIVQGNLPPTVPQFFTRPASYFYRPRAATIGGQPHTGLLEGAEPRRFKSFLHLR